MATNVPFIPDSAPFSPEQRGWLNGFLAGLFSGTAPVAASAPAPAKLTLKVAVLYASHSGTAEGLARKIAKELKARGCVPTLTSLETFSPTQLAAEEHAVLLASTYGEGDPPDGAKTFFDALSSSAAPKMSKLSYSILALGDRTYEHFCKFGHDLDDRLQALGGARLADTVECGLEVDEPFAAWKFALFTRLDQIASGAGTPAVPTAGIDLPAPVSTTAAAPTHTRENPFLAPLKDKRPLTANVSSKTTLHLAFCLREADMPYEAGDACGVVAHNDPALVAEILEATHLTGDEPVTLTRSAKSTETQTTLAEALTHHLQITRLSRKLIEAYAHRGSCTTLLGLLIPEQQTHLDAWMYDRGLIDLLTDCPGVISAAADLVAMLPRLAPRLYSISSSPAAHTAEVHATVGVVRYRSHNRDRGGVCSTLFADRTEPGQRLPLYIQPNKRFRLPQDPDAPVIMVGPGTGIAPFRSFLHERQATGARGRNWLFFGERSATTDFLYRDELEAMQAASHLTRLDLAFSRDQERKIYVQDRMRENSAELWKWIDAGASFYICGDATHMAKDVDQTLHTVIEKESGLGHDATIEYVQQLKDQNRYQRDVY